MKSSIRPLAIITVSLFGFLIIVSRYNDNSQLELTAADMHAQVLTVNYSVADSALVRFDNPLFIDIREPELFIISHKDSAINIPLSSILDKEYKTIFSKGQPKILLSNDPVKAHEAWMLLTQLGYKGLFVGKSN